jgi:hypothetical protein
MQQHLGDLLKAKLAEKQQPVQLRLFNDADYIEQEINYAMGFSTIGLYELREQNSHAFYRVKAIRDATGKFRAAERQWIKEVAKALGIID